MTIKKRIARLEEAAEPKEDTIICLTYEGGPSCDPSQCKDYTRHVNAGFELRRMGCLHGDCKKIA